MTLPLRIVVRTVVPWERMTFDEYQTQKGLLVPSEYIRRGRATIEMWERATGRRFFEYRAEVRSRCQACLEATGLPVTLGVENIDWSGPDEGLITLDDDDLILPSIVSLGHRFTENVNLIVWNRVTDYLGQVRTEPKGTMLDTCNWAVRKSFMAQLPRHRALEALARHWHAAYIIAKQLEGPQPKRARLQSVLEKVKYRPVGGIFDHPCVIQIDENYSVYFLHSASISFLAGKMNSAIDPVDYIRKLPLHPLVSHVSYRPAYL